MLNLNLSSKVSQLDESVSRLAYKEDLTLEIRNRINKVKQAWRDTSGQFTPDFSQQVDQIFTAKRNVQKVVTILADYENLAEELTELEMKLKEDDTSELADVYRKLKRYLALQSKLIEKIKESIDDQTKQERLTKIEQKF